METRTIYNYKNLPYKEIAAAPLEKRKKGNPGGTRRGVKYKSCICAFDIETTAITNDISIMYIWQAQIDDYTVTGRSWKEFFRMLRRLAADLPDNVYFVFWVHNLSFEFQFLRGVYNFKPDDVFLMESRKVLRCDMLQHFEFRCSYIHSNMNLDLYLKKFGVQHLKTTLDYSVKRYPWTRLTDDELLYCINDVRGLTEAIRIEMGHDGDNLYTIPITSTGYVRRDVKKAMRQVKLNYIKRQLPTLEVYNLLREAFRGGNTHANRYFAGQILQNVKSKDESSAYPTQQINKKFPISEFVKVNDTSFEHVADLIKRRGKAVLMRCRFWNIRLINRFWGCPYIPFDKVRRCVEPWKDNGRILSADYLEMTLTDIDLKIILKEYTFDSIECFDVYAARYGYLPDILVNMIESYYRLKTVLKGKDGDDAILYMKSKNKLNSIYGMSAQNPVKQAIEYKNHDYIPAPLDIESALAEYRRKAFFPYQWGVWTTAHARKTLEDGITLVHNTPGAEFVYCDTDSVKYTGDVDFEVLNDEIRKSSEESGGYADDSGGNRHYMGVWEDDGEYKEFATLGAKKYVYRDLENKLHVTIAGVVKSKGGPELEKAGGIKAFLQRGFTFMDAGGKDIRYNDDINEYMMIDGRRLHVTSCATITDSTYTLDITDEYDNIIEHPEQIIKMLENKKIFSDFLLDNYSVTM